MDHCELDYHLTTFYICSDKRIHTLVSDLLFLRFVRHIGVTIYDKD